VNKNIFSLLFFIAISNNAFADEPSTNQLPPANKVPQVASGTCQNFGNKLRRCERFTCTQPVPNHPGEIISNEIKGRTSSNRCHVVAVNKKEGTTDCQTDQVTLNAGAKIWDEFLKSGMPMISFTDPDHQTIITALKRGDCKITTPNGAVDMSFLNSLPDPQQMNDVSNAISGILEGIQ
jgi:hypothetical protein